MRKYHYKHKRYITLRVHAVRNHVYANVSTWFVRTRGAFSVSGRDQHETPPGRHCGAEPESASDNLRCEGGGTHLSTRTAHVSAMHTTMTFTPHRSMRRRLAKCAGSNDSSWIIGLLSMTRVEYIIGTTSLDGERHWFDVIERVITSWNYRVECNARIHLGDIILPMIKFTRMYPHSLHSGLATHSKTIGMNYANCYFYCRSTWYQPGQLYCLSPD